jgi:hypothetical protein
MAVIQHRFRHRASVLLLASLLLVPVALSGHNHVGQSTHPCSICAVTHHAPIVHTPTPPAFTARFTSLVSVPRPAPAPARTDQSPPTGRAPPSFLTLSA